MKFQKVLAGVTWLLLCERKVTYRRMKREFELDDDALEDVRHELIQIKRWAADLDGEFLVWAGAAEGASAAPCASELSPVESLRPVHQPAAADPVPAGSPTETPPPAPAAAPRARAAPAAAAPGIPAASRTYCNL